MKINQFEQRGRNLYKYCGRYYRLYAYGITPNQCWLMVPHMRLLIDIDVITGQDVIGEMAWYLGEGTVDRYRDFKHY